MELDSQMVSVQLKVKVEVVVKEAMKVEVALATGVVLEAALKAVADLEMVQEEAVAQASLTTVTDSDMATASGTESKTEVVLASEAAVLVVDALNTKAMLLSSLM